MPENIPFFRVFLSSPGDVNDERKAVLEVLERLPNRPAFREKVGFRVVAWDKPGADTPMLATMSPQAAIDAGLPRPADCDIVVCLFWSRMGTPFQMGGQDYLSGTHYELLDAIGSPRAETLIYKRTEKKFFEAHDTAGPEQYNRVQAFFNSDFFYDPTTKQIKRGVNTYSNPADFREKFETHLEDVVVRLLKKHSTAPMSAAPEIPTTSGTVITITSQAWRGSPFPGLRAFTEQDALIFFGRNRETDLLLKRLADSRFVAVVGASGSGKSSLVGAGLIPRLRANAISDEHTGSKDWFIVSFTPGSSESPFAALFEALIETFPKLRPSAFEIRRVKQNFVNDLLNDPATLRDTLTAALSESAAPVWAEVVLFIDQFEELFTLAKPDFIAPFIQLLTATAANPRVRIVATMRSDFYPKAVEYPELAELLQSGSFPLAAPTAGALMLMIKRPAEIAALEFEEELPERILTDTGSTPGALALMAYALDELYKIADQRHDRRLTFGDYAALAGVQGAIGKRAEQTFQALTLVEKETLLRQVFRELVEVDERGTATRQRAAVGRFSESELALIQALVQARLLTIDGELVEVAHEALFRSWERLKTWITEAQEDLILLRQVRNAADDWERKGRKEFLRWNHERLELVYAMQKRLNPALSEIEQDFLEPEATRLLRELENIETTHERRRDIGDRLAVIGDPRPGVGIKNGLPDLVWIAIDTLPDPITLQNNEKEIGPITIPPFFITKYPITYTQFQVFEYAEGGFDDDQWWIKMPLEYKKQPMTAQRTQIDNSPRDTVSWYQSVAFAHWLNHRLRGFELTHPLSLKPFIIGETAIVRLPNEWEWQWAAQGGSTDWVYPWGNWNGQSTNTSEAGLSRSIAVGMYPHGATQQGVFDMAGNLWEWCQNDREDILNENNFDNQKSKVLKGGAFSYLRELAACKARTGNNPNLRYFVFGLRLIMVPIEP